MKTAEEMFRDLGFRKCLSVCYNNEHILYEKPVMNGSDVEIIEFKDGYFAYTTLLRAPMKTYGKVLKAIYKQMEELEWLYE